MTTQPKIKLIKPIENFNGVSDGDVVARALSETIRKIGHGANGDKSRSRSVRSVARPATNCAMPRQRAAARHRCGSLRFYRASERGYC
jgi:hypothetical protein